MTEFEMTRSLLGHPIHALADQLSDRMKAWKRRRRFKNLLDLDDRMLNDMGVHRFEVEQAAHLPLSRDAATELRRVSLARRKRKM